MTPDRRMARAIVFYNDALLVIRRHNKKGKYYTLPGGGIEAGETNAMAAVREVFEEASIVVTADRLVYEDSSPQFGRTDYFAATYVSGTPAVHPDAYEAVLNEKGENTSEPLWLHVSEVAKVNLLPPAIKMELLRVIDQGFPEKPKILA